MTGRRENNGEDISEKLWRVKPWELWGEVSPDALLRGWCGEARLGVAGVSGRDPPTHITVSAVQEESISHELLTFP